MRKFNFTKRIISLLFLGFYFISAFHFELVHVNVNDNSPIHNHGSNLQIENYIANDDPCIACLTANQQNIQYAPTSLLIVHDGTKLFSFQNKNPYNYFINSNLKLRAPPLSPV